MAKNVLFCLCKRFCSDFNCSLATFNFSRSLSSDCCLIFADSVEISNEGIKDSKNFLKLAVLLPISFKSSSTNPDPIDFPNKSKLPMISDNSFSIPDAKPLPNCFPKGKVKPIIAPENKVPRVLNNPPIKAVPNPAIPLIKPVKILPELACLNPVSIAVTILSDRFSVAKSICLDKVLSTLSFTATSSEISNFPFMGTTIDCAIASLLSLVNSRLNPLISGRVDIVIASVFTEAIVFCNFLISFRTSTIFKLASISIPVITS